MLNIYWCLLSFPCNWNHARKDIWRTCLCLSTSFFRFITGFHSWLFEVSIDLEVIWKNHVSVIHTQSENIMHLCVILTALPNFNIEILWDVFNPFSADFTWNKLPQKQAFYTLQIIFIEGITVHRKDARMASSLSDPVNKINRNCSHWCICFCLTSLCLCGQIYLASCACWFSRGFLV